MGKSYSELKKEVLKNRVPNVDYDKENLTYQELKEKTKAAHNTYGVDDNYINTYIRDANDYISSASEDYKKVDYDNAKSSYDSRSSRSADLKARANTIRAYLNSNKDRVDEDYRAQLLSQLDEIDSATSNISNDFRRSAEYFNKFPNKTAYDYDLQTSINKAENETMPQIAQKVVADYLDQNEKNRLGNSYLSKYDDSTSYADVSSDISKLENIKGGAARRGNDTKVYDQAIAMLKDHVSYNRDLAESMTVDEVRNQKHETNEQTEQDRQDFTWLADYNNGDIIAESEEEGRRNAERAQELSAYFKEKYGIDNVTQEELVSFGTQTKASDIAFFDENGTAVTWDNYLRIKSAETKLLEIENDDTTSAIYGQNVIDNDDLKKIETAKSIVNLSFGDAAANNKPVATTEEQQEIVDYLSQKYGIDFSQDNYAVLADLENASAYVKNKFAEDQSKLKEAGYDWEELDYYNQYVSDKAEYQERKAQNEQYAEEHPVAASLESLAIAPAKIFDYAGNIADTIKSSGTDETSALGLSNVYNDTNINTAKQFTGTVSQNISNEVKDKTDSDVLAWLASASYTGVQSSVQSAGTIAACTAIFGPAAGQVISLGIMGAEAASDSFNEAVINGSTNQEALFTSLAAGVNEVLFEKLSFDHLMKMSKTLDTNSLKDFIKSVMKSSPDMIVHGLIEADEEVNTDIANTIADYLINGNHDDYNVTVERYISQGYTREEAEKLASQDTWKQLLESAYGGFIGGLTAGSGKTAINTAKSALNTAKSAMNNVSDAIEHNEYTKQAGQAVTAAGNALELVDRAHTLEGNSEAVKKIQSQADKVSSLYKKQGTGNRLTNWINDKRTTKATGKLYTSMQENNISRVTSAQETEIKSALSQAYADRIKADVNDKSVSKVVNALYKSEYTSEPLTASEKRMISTDNAKGALSDVQSNKDVIQSQINRAQRRATEDMASTAALTGTKAQTTETAADIDIDDFKLSDDGKTYTADGGEQVDVKGIASVAADDIKVELSNGKTESVKALDLGSEDQAVIYQGILDIQDRLGAPVTSSFANTVVNEYKQAKATNSSLNTTDFMHGVEEALRKGYMNDSGAYSKSSYGVNLSESARQAFFDEGRQISQEHTNAQQKAVKSRIKGTESKRKGTVTYEDGIKRSQLTERQQVGVDVVTHIAEETGIDVVFFRSTKDGKGRFSSEFVTKNGLTENGQAPNGFWLNGKMYIDVNTGMNGEGLILFTAAHEIVHMIREGSPEHFKALADFLIQNYAKKGVDVNKLVLKEMTRSTNLNYDAAYEEVIAQSCESFLRDIHLSDKAEQLYKKNKGLATKIKDILKRLMTAVKKWYGMAKPQSVEAKYVSEMKEDALGEAYDKYIAGIRAASQNLRNMEKPADKGGARYDLREYSESQKKNWENSKRIIVYQNESQLAEFIQDALAGKNLDKKMYFGIVDDTLGKRIYDDTGVDVTGYNVVLRASEIRKVLLYSHGNVETEELRGQQAVTEEDFLLIPQIISEPDTVERVGEEFNGKPTIKFVKTIQGRKTVISYVSDKHMDLTVKTMYSGKEKSLPTTADVKSPALTSKTSSGTASTNIISDNSENINTSTQKNQFRSDADYLSAVERGDMKTAQRMVDEAAERAFAKSKIRDEDGKLMKVYHGTDADFTVFDRAMGRANMDIQGLFFSPWDIDAGGYGSNVRAFYLNITNPADESTGYKALNSHKGENYAGIKAREDLERMGYDGVNNSDEEYIAFSSEQIKSAEPVTYDDDGKVIPLSQRFDSTKTDIRYQSRDNDFDLDFLFDDDDSSIESTFAKEYATHHEDIGEVLKNIADIDIDPKKVTSIVNRVIRDNFGSIDANARELLSTEIQIALERVDSADPETVINEMIDAVRKAVVGAEVTDERAAANYSDLLSAFKGRKFYLTDEQINQLAEHDMTMNDYRMRMFGKITIVSKQNAKRSIDGGFADASELSLEGLYDMLESPEEYLPYQRDQWDEYGYDAPYILMETMEKLRDMRTQPMTDVYSEEDIDYLAVALTAKITGGIVEEKYKSKYNGKDSAQIRQALQEQQKQTDDYITALVDNLAVQHETQLAEQREKNKQKLDELKQKERARAEKREKELRERYREQRARGYENRKRTEFRGKIRKLMNSFQSRLTKPHDGSYVPRELISQTVDILNAINMDTGRSTRLSEKIAALRNTYDGLKEDAQAYAVYDDTISTMLRGLSDSLGNTAIMDMSLDQLKQTYDTLRSLDHYIRESVRMTDTDEKRTAHALGREMIAETKDVPKEHSGLLSGYIQTQLRADVMFNRLAGFKKNSTWSQMARMLNNGQLHMTQLQMEFSKIFADVLTDTKQLRTLSDTKHLVDIGLVDDDGNKVPITRGMMLSLYMHLQNQDNVRHVTNGGLTVPGIREYYKGDVTKAFGEKQRSVRVGMIDFSQYAEGIKTVIEEQLTDYEKIWIGLAHEFFDVASRDAINDTTMKLYHFKKATVDNYFPIHTDSNYRAASFESITRDMSLENSGFMKERIKASNPILLEDIVDVINDQIQKVSKYCGLTIPIKNFQKVYGTTLAGFETSLQKEINKKFSGSRNNTSATKYIDNLITDLTSGRQTSDGSFAKFFSKARGNLAAATLTLNVRVAIAQAASYPTAAAEIGWKPLMKAFVRGGQSNRMISRADRAAIEEVSPLLWLRTQGYSNTEIGDIKELRKQKHQIEGKFKKAMGWIEFFDGMTVGRLFYAAQYYVDEQYPTLKRGSEEYKQKVAEVYNNVIEKTQPNYTTMQRPDILRNPNALVKSLTMFMTQRLQNFNIVYDAVGTYNKYRKDLSAGKNGVTAQDLRQAKTKLRRAIVSQTVAAGTIVGMKLFADMLMHSMNGYRDDDDELTAESISLALLNNFADTIFGSVLFGSDLYSLLKSAISGERYYGISLSGVDSFTEALENIVNLRKGITIDSANKAATSICQLMGLPLNNAEKIGKAIYNWGSDFSSGSFMEASVDRTNKQNIHRAEMRYNSGDTAGASELLNAMIEQKKSEGKTDKEARSWLRSQMTSTYKPRYVQAVKNNDTTERTAIRQFLYASGVYGSLTDLDKALSKWVEK